MDMLNLMMNNCFCLLFGFFQESICVLVDILEAFLFRSARDKMGLRNGEKPFIFY